MDKLSDLKAFIGRYDAATIAFSGGVDSSFLAKVAGEVLKDKVLLVTANSSTYPFYELEAAKKLAGQMGLSHKIIVSEETEIPGFSNNPPDRCYYCKSELFEKILSIAAKENPGVVFDGSNADDLNDYRPGMKALKEKGIVSPLEKAGMTKDDIRYYSRQYGLETADKPAYACLASRFPYGEQITSEKLDRVSKAELSIRNFGFTQFRVRSHDNLVRLEFIPEEMEQAWTKRKELNRICRNAGFSYIAIDVSGYRVGAMNETLK